MHSTDKTNAQPSTSDLFERIISNPAAKALIDRAIELAIAEDLGQNGQVDLTSDAIIGSDSLASAVVLLKEPGVVAGLDIFALVMNRFSPAINVEILIAEGSHIPDASLPHKPREVIRLSGPSGKILAAERLALNLIQRMSGIATFTKQFVDKAKPYGIQILDTRKTTPCLRVFEKYAVICAGGTNHRMGLYDNVLIKENHIRVAGGITEAVSAVRKKYGAFDREAGTGQQVEVEVTNITEVEEALSIGVEKVLLDNMTPEMVRDAIARIQGKSKIEVSGGINLSNIDQYLIEGVDYISVGALTHSVKAIDLSLEILEITAGTN